jgi:tetratricopeptide (TPR) repeat protein
MKRLVLFSVSFIFSISLFGQIDEIENWRSQGFQAKTEKDYATSIIFYQKILEADATDYDAKLALARLYILTEDYHQSIIIFNEIFSNDSTDVEAMNGLGECYGLAGNDKKSIYYYELALSFLPGDVQQYFYLARAYGNGGMLDQAIEVYQEINRVDSTYSEAWAGIGKMVYWQGKPKTSVGFYEKALSLDPENEEILEELQTVKRELDYGLSVNFGPVNEKEESYEITALISKIGFEKRMGDHFQVQASYLLDYSNRDYTSNTYDTTRWYSNVWAKGSWISEHHLVSAFGGYSNTDNKISAYGANWRLNYTAGPVTVKNSLNAGYDYFYYWNKVGKKSVSDEMQLSYRFLGFNAGYTYGMIDPVAVYNANGMSEVLSNPYQAYNLSLIFKVLKRPDIQIGLNHSYLDYKYKSSLYYSPFGRTLTGASASVYYSIARLYIYSSFSYNIGQEYSEGKKKNEKIDVDNWSSNIELGYNHQQFSFSVGASNFYNPYYQNLTGYMAIKILF